MIDYHVHTPLCNHATGTIHQYIGRAIKAGLCEICFLEHLTLNKNGRALSMSPAQLPLYYHAVQRLSLQYRDRIRVRAGLEVDFSPGYSEQVAAIIEPFAFDLIAGSVHFIENTNIVSSRAIKNNNMNIDRICDQYLSLLEKLVKSRIFDVICHIDVPKKFGAALPERFYENIDALMERIGYNEMAVEVNTSGFDHPASEQYPAKLLLDACRRYKIPVTLGSDAHAPEEVGRHFDRAIALLESSGIHSVSGFRRRVRHDIKLEHQY
ncbi:MAG: histidinol-phosphatase HisJ family protein [Deltaproteobacteria bacterium]|nr:histidinol-phosphatase HisJ family protein [Deltaproteobacteria bacterium]